MEDKYPPVPDIRSSLRVSGSSEGVGTESSSKIYGEKTQICRKLLSFSRTMRKEGTRLSGNNEEPHPICREERSLWGTGEHLFQKTSSGAYPWHAMIRNL